MFRLLHSNLFSLHFHPQMHYPEIFSFAFLIFFVAVSLIVISFSVFRNSSKTEQQQEVKAQNLKSDGPTTEKRSLSECADEVKLHHPNDNNPVHLTHSLLLEVLPSDSSKWASLFDDKSCDCKELNSISSGLNVESEHTREEQREKKRRRRSKKKKINSLPEDSSEHNKGEESANTGSDMGLREEAVFLYPFTSSGSAMQRKIKHQYDELVKCHQSKKLTLAQVVNFANSLVDARNELQHKADVIKRKFVVTKALLFKADRSSFDRFRQQIYKLELEQKRLEEDATVYNWLQQQLKLSPAYKKMLEIGACMEKAKTCELEEATEDEFADISFEELLAQEKKDSFWQKNGKSRGCSN
ncbi:uncharacterized protein LOC114745789 [Neltuma alba]|uniref:uncharacterized protein LOC114745789 n=1 Tax=Neltuma alba TaxID=207710 RepID=UPI0010A4CF3B|nr:uncharacterized protein LOC114745789 [Prosopis alba]